MNKDVRLQLTTPEMSVYDPPFPGENWFFYWKTSPSLWEMKLSHYNYQAPLYFPIYWSIHQQGPNQYDFGETRPETDLKRLIEVARKLNKDFILVLPLNPAPFLPNGGIPAFLANYSIVTKEGIKLGIVDNEQRLHKLYSFFDPKIFQAFRKFTWSLARYLFAIDEGLEIFGVRFGYLDQHGYFQSYTEDRSDIFYQGLARYKEAKSNKIDNNRESDTPDDHVSIFFKDQDDQKLFSQEIEKLYTEGAKESLPHQWAGHLNYVLLGGAPHHIFARSSDYWQEDMGFFDDLAKLSVLNLMPSGLLLSAQLRTPLLERIIREQFCYSALVNNFLDRSKYSSEIEVDFSPLVLIEVVCLDHQKKFLDENKFYSWGLELFLNRSFNLTYKFKNSLGDYLNEDNQFQSPIIYLRALDFSEFDFNHVLKLFFSSKRLLVDIDEASEVFKKRLDLFLLENDLRVESIQFKSVLVKKIHLGESSLLFFDGSALKDQSTSNVNLFWQAIFDQYGIRKLPVSVPEGVYAYWKARPSNSYELNFQEIRRLSLYNSTSYKKRISINFSNYFAFIKSLDPHHAKINHIPIGMEIELLPGGAISLDYGFYE